MCATGGPPYGPAMFTLPLPISVDPSALTVTVEAGATWGQVDAVTQRHGLAAAAGRVSTAPVSLAGDGWLVRSSGLVADNLVGARTVAGDEAGEDLLSVLRGDGDMAGLAAITLRVRPVGPAILAGTRVERAASARDVLRAYRDAMAAAPPHVGGGVVLTREAVGVLTLGGSVLGIPVEPARYDSVQRLLDPFAAAAPRSCEQTGLMPELSDGAIDALVLLASELAPPASHILLQPLGGAYAAPDLPTTFGHREARWSYRIVVGWEDPREAAAETAWALAAAAELEPYDLGVGLPGLPTRRDRTVLAA